MQKNLLYNHGVGKIILSKSKSHKEKIDSLEYQNIKLCASDDTISHMRRQPTGENIFNHI